MKIIYKIFLFGISFLLSFLILEFFISTTHIVDKSLNEVYSDIGRGRLANKAYVMFNEGFSIGHFNSFRYMGPSYPPEKKENTIRIALLGDSYVEGFQVFDRDHFRRILEDELSKKLKMNVEVLNFGRSGFDLGDMYAYNQTFVKEFNPDISLYFLSNVDLTPLFTDPLRMKVRLKNDSLVIVKEYPENYIRLYNKTKILIQYSSIFNMLNNGFKSVKERTIGPILLDKFYPNIHRTENENIEHNSVHITEITQKIVQNLNPIKDIVINRDSEALNNEFVSEIARNSILLINLSDTIDILKKSGIDPNYWKATKKEGHWNQQGHLAVGEFLAERLLQIIKESPDYQDNFK